ncbi:MAG: integral rane sensor signal transduction histidine kinase [Candidatus Eremiobacteraeota bacterium]|nr:integral rane sensor signal transduction histidine kinase [Candidatus Eremiobacteraeota bacterium]
MNAAPRRRTYRFLPSSLRARLTVSYATLTALLLTVLFCGLVTLGMQRYIRSTMLAIDEVATATRQIVNDEWPKSDAQLTKLVLQQPRPSGVQIIVRATRPKGLPPPPGTAGQSPPPQRLGGGRPERSLGGVFGLRARAVWLHQGDVIIAPQIPIEQLLAIGALAYGIAVALAVAVSWLIGRWITAQAILPLTTVTKELRRFAAGDFVPSLLETRDASELGELVDAFNGAAAQVMAAFSERERTEQHLRLFLGEAGHEMRTPLTVISAYLEVLDRTGADEITMPQETLQTLRAQTRRLRALVERVMSLARMEGNDRSRAELVDVAEIAQEAIAHVTAAQHADVRLRNTVDDVVVLAEPWELQEAIGNLVDNAVRYGAGTPVGVSIDLENGDVVVRVSDGGPGVSEADRAQLFRHFFRGEQAAGKPGSGLGLAIVARAAARLGGAVAVEDGAAPGTTFRLTLPAYQPRNGSYPARSSP